MAFDNRTGAPGYFVTKDGRFQTLMTDNGHFAICTTTKVKRGFRIIRGPAADPEDLDIKQPEAPAASAPSFSSGFRLAHSPQQPRETSLERSQTHPRRKQKITILQCPISDKRFPLTGKPASQTTSA
ncbi:MAG: hypothetical protein M3Y72_03880 [Acidobacteriota bacterium]|nr:hypothetical protein [Acidobacteriota bacterium]